VQKRTVPPPIAEGEVSARWQEFIAEVRKHRISLGSVLESTNFLGVKDGAVRIGCADDFTAAAIQRNKESLVEMFQQVFKARVHLDIEVQGTVAPAGSPSEQANGTPDEEHPIIAAMKRELGAEPL
jgi:hypothetical protein